MIIAVPVATPVVTPVEGATVATAVLLLVHVPPDTDVLNVVTEPVQTDMLPVTGVEAVALTVTNLEAAVDPQLLLIV